MDQRMTLAITPFLMFQGDAGPALDFYLATFPDSRVEEIHRYGPGEAAPQGQVRLARFTLAGRSVMCIDSPAVHAFTFTPSFSFWIDCPTADEVRRLAGVLKEGGAELMPVGDYGFSRLFGWVTDRFGVSWQLNCA